MEKAAAEEAPAENAPQSGKYLCLEMQVLITAEGKPLALAGWSVAAKNAVLIDAEGNPVPAAEGSRPSKGATVSPGGSHSQVLVFESPAGPIDSLKLALAGSVAGLDKPLGFEIKGNLLAGKPATPAHATPPIAAPVRPAPMPAAEPKEEPAPEPAPAPADAPPPIDPEGDDRIPIPGLIDRGKSPIRRRRRSSERCFTFRLVARSVSEGFGSSGLLPR